MALYVLRYMDKLTRTLHLYGECLQPISGLRIGILTNKRRDVGERGDIRIPGLRFITPGPCLAARDNKISKLVDGKIATRGCNKGRLCNASHRALDRGSEMEVLLLQENFHSLLFLFI